MYRHSAIQHSGGPCCSLSLSFSTTAPSCGQADGAIDLIISNGSGNYAISWGNGSAAEDQSNLSAGTYSVTVTDLDDNCQTDTLISLSDANAPVLDSLIAVPETCTGQNDGSITIYVSGGVQPYTYTWSVPGTSNQVTGLAAGTYNFRVIDAAGCTLNGTGLGIIPPAPPCCNLQINVNATYNGCDSLANLLISVSGPTAVPPYQFNLNGVNYTGGILSTNIGPGNYELHVTDQTGCSDTFLVVVPSSTNYIQLSSAVTQPSCSGLSDGAIDLTVQVANPPATFNWSSGQSTEDLTGLAAGTYSVTVAEQSGCSLSRIFVLADPPQTMLDLGDDRLRCSGDTILIDAGMPVLWNDGTTSSVFVATSSSLISAVYTDASGCTATDTVSVDIEPIPVVDAGEDSLIYAGNTYTLNPQIVSGNPSGSYLWSPPLYLSCTDCTNPIAAPREEMLYVLTFSSSTGCDASDSVRIRVRNDFAFFLPNAFTPDGDGNNDLLLAYGNGVIQFSLKVFNRTGEKVFETTNLQTGWDGTYRGQNAPQAVYVYEAKVTFASQRTEYFRGSLSLLR